MSPRASSREGMIISASNQTTLRPFDHRLPRLYLKTDLSPGLKLTLSGPQHHYIARVLRRQISDQIVLFNGSQGEWLGEISAIDKKHLKVRVQTCRRQQPTTKATPWLIFAPLKKSPMDFLIEKVVELGISTLQPVITDYTMTKKVNQDRLHTQIIEATEQCERLTLPDLRPILPLKQVLADFPHNRPVWWAAEAGKAPAFPDAIEDTKADHNKNLAQSAILIGPEGGFSDTENTFLHQHPQVIKMSLGAGLLRAETAALAALACLQAGLGAWSDRPDFRSIIAQ